VSTIVTAGDPLLWSIRVAKGAYCRDGVRVSLRAQKDQLKVGVKLNYSHKQVVFGVVSGQLFTLGNWSALALRSAFQRILLFFSCRFQLFPLINVLGVSI